MAKEINYYFPHDCNAHEDLKIKKLIRKYGYEGYGLWWHFLEVFRSEENYKLDYDLENFEIIFYPTGINLEEFITFCIKIKLFILENNQIFSKSFLQRMEYYKEMSEKRSVAGRKGAIKKWQNYGNANENSSNAKDFYGNALANSSNKIKQNKIKQNNISLYEIENFCREKNLKISAKDFFEHYEKLDWKINGEEIKDWKALIVTWNDNANVNNKEFVKKSKFENFESDHVDYDDFEKNNLKKLMERYGDKNG